MTRLAIATDEPTTHAASAEARPEVASWWWVSGDDKDREYDRDGRWLGCVIEVGSNYVMLEGVHHQCRLAIPDLYETCEPEADPRPFIDGKVGRHRAAVRELMGEIRQVCARLGVPVQHALAPTEVASQALATTAGVGNVLEYKTALVLAKDKELPELYKAVEKHHAEMAAWMKAELIPAEAELEAARQYTKVIAGKINTVELYAGLQEQLVCVREGAPAGPDERLHLMQRRCYMDEECLARYEAGGMDFQDVSDFDRWLGRTENLTRLLPYERCIVAFRVRRHKKHYEELAAFIEFNYDRENTRTFLYIRNGRQLHRMETSIEFGEHLFPKREDSDLLGDEEIWFRATSSTSVDFISGRQRAARIQLRKQERRRLAAKLRQWRAAGKPKGDWTYIAIDDDGYRRAPGTSHHQRGEPWRHFSSEGLLVDSYDLLTPECIYHDDAMRKVQAATLEHNRIAVIVQGLLDRSTCLHPHPPWKIWTPEGFAAGVELVYDVSRAITPGEAPSWEGYRAQLNQSTRPGCYTIGQARAWKAAMEEKYGRKWRDYARTGNGPSRIDMVHEVKRDGSCEFRFSRDRVKPKWVPNPDRPGWMKPAWPEIPMSWWCAPEHLTCVDGYVPGDFHMFYDDARTRELYVQWAPILLAAEDWHHRRRLAAEAQQVADAKMARKKPRGATRKAEAQLDEADWRTVFALRCRSKRGEILSKNERALVDRAFRENETRYREMEADVFNGTTPFGSTARARPEQES